MGSQKSMNLPYNNGNGTPLNIYILSVKKSTSMPSCGYDCFHKFVVCAFNEEHARVLAQEKSYGDEVHYAYQGERQHGERQEEKISFWTNHDLTDCVVYNGEVGVISEEFNAG